MAFINGRGTLIATRLLVGVFEAGFYPTSVAFLSTFYRRFDLAVRIALFYGQYAIAGAFSGAMGELTLIYFSNMLLSKPIGRLEANDRIQHLVSSRSRIPV